MLCFALTRKAVCSLYGHRFEKCGFPFGHRVANMAREVIELSQSGHTSFMLCCHESFSDIRMTAEKFEDPGHRSFFFNLDEVLTIIVS